MPRVSIQLDTTDQAYIQQVKYSLSFVSEEVESFHITDDGILVAELSGSAQEEGVRRKIESLLERYAKPEFGFKEVIHFEQHRDLPLIDTWQELLDRRWITQVGQGHVIMRGPAANVMRLLDARVERAFAQPFEAEPELYPATILCETLDRVNHFTSFPEHIDFVSHLRRDVDELKAFADGCRDASWSPDLHKDRMSPVDFAMSPSCCYHCYEGMEDWELEAPGRTITATLHCHRYEAGNLQSLSRLRAFTMREVVFVGHPKWVREQRDAGTKMLIQWAKDWELDCTVENANDMFFTDDFAVKASFQRQQEGKVELCLTVPCEKKAIACASSNFHSVTFGKAFNITVNGRPAASACLAWGYERWVYAIFSQFGFDVPQWPEQPREEYYELFGRDGA